jgi:hypothetical protein
MDHPDANSRANTPEKEVSLSKHETFLSFSLLFSLRTPFVAAVSVVEREKFYIKIIER